GRIDELHLAAARFVFAVRQDPDIGGDAGVVEELLRQRDDRLEPVVLQDPAANLTLAAAGIPGEEGRAVHDDGDAAPAFLRLVHAREHVLQEQELPIADPGEPGAKATREASLR